jgi:hypothetical protein
LGSIRGSIVVRFISNRLGIDLGVSMQRREFVTLIGVAAVTQGMLPQLACVQASTKRPLLAVLAGVTRREFPASFMEGMRELGYVEGGNIDVVYRFADGRLDLLPALAEELIQFTYAKSDIRCRHSCCRRSEKIDPNDPNCLPNSRRPNLSRLDCGYVPTRGKRHRLNVPHR